MHRAPRTSPAACWRITLQETHTMKFLIQEIKKLLSSELAPGFYYASEKLEHEMEIERIRVKALLAR